MGSHRCQKSLLRALVLLVVALASQGFLPHKGPGILTVPAAVSCEIGFAPFMASPSVGGISSRLPAEHLAEIRSLRENERSFEFFVELLRNECFCSHA